MLVIVATYNLRILERLAICEIRIEMRKKSRAISDPAPLIYLLLFMQHWGADQVE
jgi:hypothetical protein